MKKARNWPEYQQILKASPNKVEGKKFLKVEPLKNQPKKVEDVYFHCFLHVHDCTCIAELDFNFII